MLNFNYSAMWIAIATATVVLAELPGIAVLGAGS